MEKKEKGKLTKAQYCAHHPQTHMQKLQFLRTIILLFKKLCKFKSKQPQYIPYDSLAQLNVGNLGGFFS